jgi:hypothetical protein
VLMPEVVPLTEVEDSILLEPVDELYQQADDPRELSFSEEVRVRGVVFVSVLEVPSDLT